ncbi:MAG TPA: hypothetical protein VMH23_02340, partial [Bacteroidota bacterium]|nr:hypothetical protein [Bacteroidota bacterium]
MRSRIAMAAMAFVVCSSAGLGQFRLPEQPYGRGAMTLSGNVHMDLISGLQTMAVSDSALHRQTVHPEGWKSPLLAGAMSIVVPGSGEVYTSSYWRAGGFLVAEAGLWVFYVSYYTKGNNQTTLFQDFADQHWSVVRYAQWIQNNLAALNPDVSSFTGYMIAGTDNQAPWLQVDWSKLNAVENAIAQRSGNGFTHQLPHRPEQQYYELIGKYPQFAAGWDDAGVMTPDRIVNSDVSAKFLEYSKMRGKANDFYNIATTGSILLVVNHLLSAIDAAWSAAQHNTHLTM